MIDVTADPPMTPARRSEAEPTFQVRLDDDGTVDEIIASNVRVHLERMDDGCVWVQIGPDLSFFLTTRGKLGLVVQEGAWLLNRRAGG